MVVVAEEGDGVRAARQGGPEADGFVIGAGCEGQGVGGPGEAGEAGEVTC